MRINPFNISASALGLLVLAGGLVTAPSTALACGSYSDMEEITLAVTCGVIDEVVAIDSEDGVVGIQFRGAFAWAETSTGTDLTADTPVAEPVLAFFETRCVKESPDFEACQADVRALVLAVKQNKAVGFNHMMWAGGFVGLPHGLNADGDVPNTLDAASLPWVYDALSENPACAVAAELLADEVAPRHTPPVVSPVVPFSFSAVRPNIDLTALSQSDALELDAEPADLEETASTDAQLAGCSAGAGGGLGFGMSLVAWLATLMVLAIRRREVAPGTSA